MSHIVRLAALFCFHWTGKRQMQLGFQDTFFESNRMFGYGLSLRSRRQAHNNLEFDGVQVRKGIGNGKQDIRGRQICITVVLAFVCLTLIDDIIIQVHALLLLMMIFFCVCLLLTAVTAITRSPHTSLLASRLLRQEPTKDVRAYFLKDNTVHSTPRPWA